MLQMISFVILMTARDRQAAGGTTTPLSVTDVLHLRVVVECCIDAPIAIQLFQYSSFSNFYYRN